jgi:hypothetical protein
MDYDASSTTSEDSQEPYYHITTGKVVKAREAWAILAAENHPRYAGRRLSRNDVSPSASGPVEQGSNGGLVHADNRKEDANNRIMNESIFRSSDEEMISSDDAIDNLLHDLSSPSFESNNNHHHIRQDSSFSADPTQSSIDRALINPESPTASISPYKDMKQIYKPASTNSPFEDGHHSSHNPYINNHHNAEVPPPYDTDDDEESDPIILRATAMALAAQNGLKLTPEQMALIAQPDVQQQKLIEEAKRVQKAKEMQLLQQQQGSGAVNLQSLSADIKKFIRIEKEKPPMQWGADLGKFIESQIQHAHHAGGAGASHASSSSATTATNANADLGQEGKNGDESSSSTPRPSPPKKKMEGFGCDPTVSATPSEPFSSSLLGGKGLNWPILNESITNILPGGGGGGGGIANRSEPGGTTDMLTSSSITSPTDTIDFNDPVIISTTSWKRRAVGKRNAMMLASSSSSSSSWERIRVELRGNKLIYYKASAATTTFDGREKKDDDNGTSVADSTTKRLSVLFQAAEQKIQTAKEEFNRLASGTGLERKTSSSSDPLGVMDLVKENASVSASMGHSGAPTPFCLSIKVKSETKWKFSFDRHGEMMEWLCALTDVIVQSSVDASGSGREMEMYCIQRRGGQNRNHGDKAVAAASSTSLRSFFTNAAFLGDKETKWVIWATLALLNFAVILARTTGLSFLKLIILFNLGMWQLTRYSLQAVGRVKMGNNLTSTPTEAGAGRKWSYKPIAGSTTIKVTKEDDPNITEKGHQLPTWVPISSSGMEVRSHGYLTTKRKIPSPGELYECVAVDCFVSNSRVSEIATRMKFDQQFEATATGKTWKSPDIFIVSIAIPTEAPKLGYSADDGPGATIVGYFKMKEETRTILRRITATSYDPLTDSSDSEIDVQKQLTNGVRLWEQFCQVAPTDSTFQARFKLIPSANLEEMGCPSYIAKYNAKPVLIKRNQVTGFFTDYPTLNAMEFDISLHPFPYLFKQGMAYIKEYFDKSVWTFGFVIEGRNNDELPEVVVGAMKVCHPSPKFTVNADELFSGTCSKVQ